MGNITVVLKGDNGHYLARCNGCVPGGGDSDSATVHAASPGDGPFAQWTLQLQSNGKYTLQSDSGKYLARCRDCVPGGAYQDSAFVHTMDPGAAWAQWTIVLVP